MEQKTKTVILLGSANSQGNTYTIASYVAEVLGIPLIDLLQKNIGDFDYTHKNKDDDFLPLMEELVTHYDTIILATPVYWYTMSAIMKRFLDRFSDLLKVHTTTGRLLRGKNLAIISCGSHQLLKKGFYMPFVETANYLGMNYIGDVHTWMPLTVIEESVKERIHDFVKKIAAVT